MPVAVATTDTPQLRKARGAFFTPPEVASYIARWAVRSPEDGVLEPSCGEAEFLLAAGARLHELGVLPFDASRLHGVELHDESASAARRFMYQAGYAADIQVGDFFDASLVSEYDAVIGNPPYVRYQGFTGDARAKAQQAALRAGVRLSGLASSWAAFTIRASTLLRRGGRLGLVLPAELLTVNYAAPVRRFLLSRFASVRLVMFDERVFPGVLAEVVLLLAEGEGGVSGIEVSQARNLRGLGDPPTIRWSPPTPESKWSPALLGPAAADAYRDLVMGSAFDELQTWGSTDLGMVSGNNRYFTLSASEANAAGLAEDELLRISPPGSRHLRGLTFSDVAWSELRHEERRVYLLAPRSTPSPAAQAYIDDGARRGVPRAYKCRVRQPWWHVPRVAPPDLFFTYMNADTPRITTNEAAVSYLNSVHGVRLRAERRDIGRDLLPLGALNSLTVLGAELVGRSYGGGILKLEPREADLLPVPSAALLSEVASELRALRPHLAQHLRAGDLLGAVERVDRVLLIEGAGLRRSDVRELRASRAVMHSRRASRGAS